LWFCGLQGFIYARDPFFPISKDQKFIFIPYIVFILIPKRNKKRWSEQHAISFNYH